jgi:hypothetical protein
MTTTNIVSNGNASDQAELIAKLMAENAALKAKAASRSRLTVKAKPLGHKDDKGEDFKGNVAVYGLGKYPVTLYPEQWLKLLAIGDEIKDTIELHREELAWKNS